MRCPDCNKEVGNSVSCPYCGATIPQKTQVEEMSKMASESIVSQHAKPLFSNALTAFCFSAMCIVFWYFIAAAIYISMGEIASNAFSISFTSKIFITLIIGLITAFALAFSNKMTVFSKKIICVIICVVLSVLSYLILAVVGADSQNVSAELYSLVVISKSCLLYTSSPWP